MNIFSGTYSKYTILYNTLEINFQNYLETLHSIEVTVQDTKRIDGLSSVITEKTELKWTIISICGRHLLFKMATMKQFLFVISFKEVITNLLM